MLEVKLNNVNDGASVSSDVSLVRMFRGMLRTTYGYAKDTPDVVHLYVRLINKTSAVVVPLFQFKGNLYEMNNLADAEVVDKAGEKVDLEFDSDRQMSLHKYLGSDLLNDVVPFLENRSMRLPDELLLSYNVGSDKFDIEINYLSLSDFSEDEQKFKKDVPSAVSDWKNQLLNPDEKEQVNIYDFEELLGEDFMLDLELLD